MEGLSLKRGFADALLKAAKKQKNLVLLTSDVVPSAGLEEFVKVFKDRYFSFGMAEDNMVSAALGFVVRGKLPIIVGSAAALCKAWQQIRNAVCYTNVNVKIVGIDAGLSVGQDGAGMQALEDLALMRCLPNMKVVSPADYYETVAAFDQMLLDYGPVYMRLPAGEAPFVFNDECEFEFGKFRVLRDGKDVCLFATGSMVSRALKVADLLSVEGIEVMVANVASLKPLDWEKVAECSDKVKICVTVEDHGVTGGLGDAIATVLAEVGADGLHKIGVDDVFGESGQPDDLYRKYKLDIYGICEQVREIL